MTVDSALSLPTRECGLKYDEKDRICIRINVTPYAGVWIEMSVSVSLTVKYLVTPYAGVWIEIQYIRRGRWIYVSLPTRECGLKSLWLFVIDQQPSSLPTRECGLKYQNTHLWPLLYSRHSLRGSVDWNRKIWQLLPWGIVTPYAGVWIEIEITPYISSRSESLPTRECGLKFFQKSTIGFDHRHSLRGSVDWNLYKSHLPGNHRRHSLRGSVDWNSIMDLEIYLHIKSLPTRECGLKSSHTHSNKWG